MQHGNFLLILPLSFLFSPPTHDDFTSASQSHAQSLHLPSVPSVSVNLHLFGSTGIKKRDKSGRSEWKRTAEQGSRRPTGK
mmetsp:Transcript_6013/g.11922  ORF Transcript_6013/g.11922 Transcript_6013/m.11922 type:complete len:81 (-) Transcript_6013:43-285(-)